MSQNKILSFVLTPLISLIFTNTYQARSLIDMMNVSSSLFRVNWQGTIVSFRDQGLTEITEDEIVILHNKYPNLQVLDLTGNKLTGLPQNLELLTLKKLYLGSECCTAQNLEMLKHSQLMTEIRILCHFQLGIRRIHNKEVWQQLLLDSGRAAGSDFTILRQQTFYDSDLYLFAMLGARRERMDKIWVSLRSIITSDRVHYEDKFDIHRHIESLDKKYLVGVNGSRTILDISIHQLGGLSQSDLSQIELAFPNLKTVIIGERYSSHFLVKFLKNKGVKIIIRPTEVPYVSPLGQFDNVPDCYRGISCFSERETLEIKERIKTLEMETRLELENLEKKE